MEQQTYKVVGPIADRDDLVHGDLLRLRNALGEVALPLLVHDTPHHAPRQLALPHLQGVGKAVIAAAMYAVKRKEVCERVSEWLYVPIGNRLLTVTMATG